MLKPSGVVPDTMGIRLRTDEGTPSFDSEGQVQGRLEVKVGDDWFTVGGVADSFGGSGSDGGEAESTVACRQLGNELGYTLVSASKVGRDDTNDGSGAQVATFTCFGMEAAITSCVPGPTYSDVAANHIYDVGVSCTFLVPSDDCEECVAGKYSNTTSNAVCMDCVAGLYSSTRGATSCEQVRVMQGQIGCEEKLALTHFDLHSARPARRAQIRRLRALPTVAIAPAGHTPTRPSELLGVLGAQLDHTASWWAQ